MTAPGDAGGSRVALGLTATVLLAATIFAYAPALDAGFLTYDDPKYVSANPAVQGGLSREGAVWAFTGIHDANWIPLVWLSLMADHSLFGDDPRGYHASNVVFHALATLLLLLALRRMTGELLRPAFVAGVFALHPLHVQSVAWIAERKDVLSGVFFMATLLAHARYLERRSPARYGAVFALLSLGLLCKATAVTLPFVLLLLDLWPGGRLRQGAARIRQALLEKLPLLIPVALACGVTLLAQGAGGAMGMARLSLASRIGHAFVAYGFYLEKALWPSGLMFFYRHPELPPASPLVLVWAGLLLAASLGVVLAARRNRAADPLAVGWLWFLGTLVPMIGIVQVGAQGMADRYTYIPLVGLALAVAWLPGIAGSRLARPAAALGALLLALLAVATRGEVRHWQASEPLYRRAIALDSDNFMAHYELARLLNAEGRPAEAEAHAREAVRLVPVWSDAYLNLGAALLGQERPEEAIQALRRALARSPGSVDAQRLLALSLLELDRLPEARRILEGLVKAQPGDVAARLALGQAAERAGEPERAWQEYAVVVQLAGNHSIGRDAAARLVALVASWPEAPAEAREIARRASTFVRSQPPDAE